MPKLNKLPKLENLMIKNILKWLIDCANSHYGAKSRSIQREYIANILSGHMMQHLLSFSLHINKTKMDLANKCLMIELLSNETTLYLDLTSGGTIIIEELFKLYRTLISCLPFGMIKFGVKCDIKHGVDNRYITDVNSFFYRLLSQMKMLRWVTLTSVGDTEILRQMGQNCENLEYLDLSNSWKVSDRAVAHLLFENPKVYNDKTVEQLANITCEKNPCCDKLKYFGLSGTDITDKSICMCFRHCPKILSFGGFIHQGSVVNIMELLHHKDSDRLFNIQQLWEDKISELQTELLINVCPLLNAISTSCYSLPALQLMSSLTSLTLDCDFQDWGEDLYSYLLSHGKKLKSLVLNDNVNCKLDIGWLMELTPSLTYLSAFVFYSNIGYPVPWDSLQEAKIVVDSSKCLYELLVHTPELNKLHVIFQAEPYQEDWTCINDNLILDITGHNGLIKAKSIHIADSALSIVALENLILHCYQLETISTLSLWKYLTKEEVDVIESQSIKSNWNLNLIFYGES